MPENTPAVKPAGGPVELFVGRMWDGCPVAIAKIGDRINVQIAFFSFSLDTDLWFDFTGIVCMVADKLGALEEGDVDKLREVQKDMNDRNADVEAQLLADSFCPDCADEMDNDGHA